MTLATEIARLLQFLPIRFAGFVLEEQTSDTHVNTYTNDTKDTNDTSDGDRKARLQLLSFARLQLRVIDRSTERGTVTS